MSFGKFKSLLAIIALSLLSGCTNHHVVSATIQESDLLDADFDGVINERDLCGETPLGAKIDNDGCSELNMLEKHNDIIVLFEHDSAYIDPIQMDEIARAAKVLKNNPELAIVLEGHTSASGSNQYNYQLSKLRAKAVQQAFISKGLTADKVAILPLGETVLLTEEQSPQAESLNRRVTAQFKLVSEAVDYKWHIYAMDSSS